MSESFDKARDAAWRAFGAKHYRWFVAAASLRKALVPVLIVAGFAGIGWGVWLLIGWVATVHVPTVRGWWLAVAAVVLAATGGVVWVARARGRYRRRFRSRVAVGVAAVAAAVAGVLVAR